MIPGIVASAGVHESSGGTATFSTGTATTDTYDTNPDVVSVVAIDVPADLVAVVSITVPLITAGAGNAFRGIIWNEGDLTLVGATPEVVLDGSETELVLTFTTPVPLDLSGGLDAWAFGIQESASGTQYALSDSADYIVNWFSATYADGPPEGQSDSHFFFAGAIAMTITYTT